MELLRSFIGKYAASPFVRNVSKLTGATAVSQLISVGTAPILYRIYDKEYYGTLGVFMAVTGVIGTFSTLQYSQAIITEKDDNEALQVLWLVRLINSTVAMISLMFVLVFGDWLSTFLNNSLLNSYLLFLPLSIFFSGQNELFRIWANRQKKYSVMTLNGILTSLLVPLVSISFGLIYKSPLGLFLGLLTSQVVPALFMGWQLSKDYSFGLKTLKIREVKMMAIRHINFPRYSLPAEFINRFSNQLPTFMLSLYSGAASVAAYNLSVRMLSLPIQLMSASIGEVFRQRASEDYNASGNCRPIFIKTFRMLITLSIFPTIIILLWGPQLFIFFFGSQWKDAGIYSQILSGLYLIRFTASPLSYVFIIARKQKEDFLWHIWMLISSFAAFYIGFYFYNSSLIAIAIFATNYFLIYVIYLYKSLAYSRNDVIH